MVRISPDIAKQIAREAISEPYRQIDALPTEKFRQWLRKRDIHFVNWQTLHVLWATGILRPVAVQNDALTTTPILDVNGRFEEVELGWHEPAYVDLGSDIQTVPARSAWQGKFDSALRDSLWWHPFQLPQLLKVSTILQSNTAIDMSLQGSAAYAKFAGESVASVPDRLMRFAQEEQNESFQRLLALLLAVEPLIHPSVYGSITVTSDEMFEQYFEWRESIDAASLMQLGRVGKITTRAGCRRS